MTMTSHDIDINVAVIFSHGVGLETWQDAGILDREISYYGELAASAGSMTFITYDRGGAEFDALAQLAAPIRVRGNDTRLPYQFFGLIAPFRYFRTFRQSDVIRTNQFSGAWVGVLAKWLSRRPLVVRGGFVQSQFADRQKSASNLRRAAARWLEGFSLRRADGMIVATPTDRDFIVERHRIRPGRITIVPNPIDLESFRPGETSEEKRGLVLTVGRLAPQKNLPELMAAMKSIDGATLQIVGTGPEEHELRAEAGANVEFLGLVPNRDIPELLRQAQIFVLASHYEGSPKALLEAMACGMAVVGADSPGIRELIEDGVNGLLVPGEAEILAEAITRLLNDDALRSRLGAAAREYVESTNSQAVSVMREIELLRQLVDS